VLLREGRLASLLRVGPRRGSGEPATAAVVAALPLGRCSRLEGANAPSVVPTAVFIKTLEAGAGFAAPSA